MTRFNEHIDIRLIVYKNRIEHSMAREVIHH